jgi:hypothetical protein
MKIIRASKSTSGVSGVDAPGLAIEVELDNGSNARLYIREGWGTDKMAINGELKPLDIDLVDDIEFTILQDKYPIKLDMEYPEYLNWVPGSIHDSRYGTFEDWQKLNGIND